MSKDDPATPTTETAAAPGSSMSSGIHDFPVFDADSFGASKQRLTSRRIEVIREETIASNGEPRCNLGEFLVLLSMAARATTAERALAEKEAELAAYRGFWREHGEVITHCPGHHSALVRDADGLLGHSPKPTEVSVELDRVKAERDTLLSDANGAGRAFDKLRAELAAVKGERDTERGMMRSFAVAVLDALPGADAIAAVRREARGLEDALATPPAVETPGATGGEDHPCLARSIGNASGIPCILAFGHDGPHSFQMGFGEAAPVPEVVGAKCPHACPVCSKEPVALSVTCADGCEKHAESIALEVAKRPAPVPEVVGDDEPAFSPGMMRCPDCHDGGACLPGGCGVDGCQHCGKPCPSCNGSCEVPDVVGAKCPECGGLLPGVNRRRNDDAPLCPGHGTGQSQPSPAVAEVVGHKTWSTGKDSWVHGSQMPGDWHKFLGPCPSCGARCFNYGGGWRCLAAYCCNNASNPAPTVGDTPWWWSTDIQVVSVGTDWEARGMGTWAQGGTPEHAVSVLRAAKERTNVERNGTEATEKTARANSAPVPATDGQRGTKEATKPEQRSGKDDGARRMYEAARARLKQRKGFVPELLAAVVPEWSAVDAANRKEWWANYDFAHAEGRYDALAEVVAYDGSDGVCPYCSTAAEALANEDDGGQAGGDPDQHFAACPWAASSTRRYAEAREEGKEAGKRVAREETLREAIAIVEGAEASWEGDRSAAPNPSEAMRQAKAALRKLLTP